MSEDEKKTIDMLEKYITEHKLYNIKQSNGLEDNIKILLDLYQQEKEKNQKLSEELTVNICNGIEVKVFEEMRTELKQEKEKNKKLQIRCKELIKEKQELNTALLYDNISKDKIRDKQIEREFELQQEYKEFKDDIEWKTYNKILED